MSKEITLTIPDELLQNAGNNVENTTDHQQAIRAFMLCFCLTLAIGLRLF